MKMQVSKTTSIIGRLFNSTDIHYNNNLNTHVLKQNDTKIGKPQTKVVESIIFRIHCHAFFQQTSSFSKFSAETSYKKT